jgi:hypothetical protein
MAPGYNDPVPYAIPYSMFHPTLIFSSMPDFHQPAPNFSMDMLTNAESVLTSDPVSTNTGTGKSGKRKKTSRRRSPKTVDIYAGISNEQVAKTAVRVSTAVCKISPF